MKSSQMRMLFGLLFIVVTLGLPPAFAGLCVDELNGRKPIFEFEDPRLNMRQGERALLGSGFFSTVYLHFNKIHDKWTAIKVYRQDHDMTAFIDSDIKAIGILELLKDRHPFKVASYTKHSKDPYTVEVEYRPGQTLEQVLADKKIKPELKAALMHTYQKGLSNLKMEMEKRYFENIKYVSHRNVYDNKIIHNTLQAENLTVTGEVKFWIKPDNIIVDPYTLELTIVDPR